jgi:hypothetical protein
MAVSVSSESHVIINGSEVWCEYVVLTAIRRRIWFDHRASFLRRKIGINEEKRGHGWYVINRREAALYTPSRQMTADVLFRQRTSRARMTFMMSAMEVY